jgi:hypothetical protein
VFAIYSVLKISHANLRAAAASAAVKVFTVTTVQKELPSWAKRSGVAKKNGHPGRSVAESQKRIVILSEA